MMPRCFTLANGGDATFEVDMHLLKAPIFTVVARNGTGFGRRLEPLSGAA